MEEEAGILKEMEETCVYIKNEVVDTCSTMSNINLEIKKEGDLETMEENADYLKSSALVTQAVVSDDESVPGKQETTDFLTVPEAFDDVAVTFTEEEWKMLTRQDKKLYREVMVQNYETLISVGYRIPLYKLLLLFKQDYEEPPNGDKKVENVKDVDSLEEELCSIRSTQCSAGCSQLPSLIQFQLQQIAENLHQCGEPVKCYNILLLAPVLQHHSGHQWNKSCECDSETSPLHHPVENLQQSSDKLHLTPAPHDHSGHNCSNSMLSDNETPPLHHTSDNMQHYIQPVNDPVKFHLIPASQLHSLHNCSQCSECDNETLRLHHCTGNLQQCTPFVNSYKVNLSPAPQFNSGQNCSKTPECNSETALLHYPTKNVQQCTPHVMDADKVHPPVVPQNRCDHNYSKMSKCNSSFSIQQGAVIQKRSHTEEKSYKHPEHNKCFTQKQNLTTHQQIHKGLKLYKCVECSKCFTQRYSLNSHRRVHREEKPYKCAECNKCFKYRKTFNNHRRVHTGENVQLKFHSKRGRCIKYNIH